MCTEDASKSLQVDLHNQGELQQVNLFTWQDWCEEQGAIPREQQMKYVRIILGKTIT